jgi:hypothetical protein
MGESGSDLPIMDYRSVGGSSWFDYRDDESEAYDVHYHHLAGDLCSDRALVSTRLSTPAFTTPSVKTPVPDVGASLVRLAQFSCRFSSCGVTFSSRNQLHKHLQESEHYSPEVASFTASTGARVVKPTKRPILGTGYAFRGYRYAEVQIRASISGEDQWACADSGCGMSVADESWFRDTFPEAHVAAMPVPIRIKGIASDAHISDRYSVVTVFLPGQCESESVLVEMELELHLVQGLSCHLLIGVDMLKPYGIALDFASSLLKIPSCNTVVQIRTRALGNPTQNRRVKVSQRVVVPPYSRRAIPITFKPFSHDRDVNFLPKYNQSLAYVAHAGAFLESLCSNTTSAVLYHNKTDRPVIFSRNAFIGEMTEFEEDSECLFLDAEIAPTVLVEPFSSAERHAESFDSPSTATGLHLSAEAYLGIGDRLVPKSTEDKLSDAMGESILDDIGTPDIGSSINDIHYGPNLTPSQLARLKEVVIRHRTVWEKSDGVVDEPPEDWLKIKLKKNANLKSRGVYRLGTKDKLVVR